MLPDEIGGLQYLQSLSLSDNKLRRLPETLSTLSRLRVLHLHQNMLTTLPHGTYLFILFEGKKPSTVFYKEDLQRKLST